MDVPGDTNRECDGAATFKDDAPGLALAVDKQQGHCWYDGGYNHRDFSIQPGRAGPFRAYRVSAPQTTAQNFAASHNTMWLSFQQRGTYTIYLLDESSGELEAQGTVTSSEAGAFVQIPVLADGAKTVVVAPASTQVIDGSVTTTTVASVTTTVLMQGLQNLSAFLRALV